MSSGGSSGKSLMGIIKNQLNFKFHFQNESGSTVFMTLHDQNLTIREAITLVVEKFNIEQQLNLVADWTRYQVYGAKKCGKKKSGMPSFDKSQLLGQTALKNFFLELKIIKPQLKKLESNQSIKSIQSQMNWGCSSKNKPEITQSLLMGCFCRPIKSN